MKKNIVFLLLIVLIYSCKEESFIETASPNRTTTVLDRSSNYPWIPYEQRDILKRISKVSGDIMTLRSVIGKSYKVDETEYPMSNIGIDIIDMPNFNKENPGYFSVRRLGVGNSSYFSYADFSRYESNSVKTKSVDGGFELKLGLFSIGAKHKMTSVFTENTVNESNRAFAELNILIKDSAYILTPTENVINKLGNYLKPIFLEELHMNTPEQFFQAYGGFVVAGINAGGMAEVLYTGKYNQNENKTIIEKDMNTSVNASYGFKYDGDKNGGNASGNLGIGKKYSNSQSTTSKITDIRLSVRTIGGSPEYASFTSPKSIDNIDIDLNSWLKTLSDKNTHTIVEFPENSLIPMTNFILEKNLKDAFTKFYNNGITSVKRIQEPKITIEYLGPLQSNLFSVYGTYLNTRYGDKLILNISYQSHNRIGDYLKKETEKWSKIMGVKIEAENYPIQDVMREAYMTQCLDVKNVTKYTAPNGIIYLLYEGRAAKFAYSIYNATIIDDYAMRNFVNSLPTTEITMDKLKKEYTVYAL